MPRPGRTKRDRWASLISRLGNRIANVEAAGFIAQAEDLELFHDSLELGYSASRSAGKNHLLRYFGAPKNPIDLQQELLNPATRRHLTSPDESATPLTLWLYVQARNDRVEKFELWRAGGNRLPAMAGTVMILAKGYRASRKGAHPAFRRAMAARAKEIKFLRIAINSCDMEVLAAAQPETDFSQDLLSDSINRPWQLGHIFLLRTIANDDIEITAEQRSQISEVIKFSRSQQP